MTACESSGYTGASFSITTTVFQIRHIIYTDFFSSSSSSLSLMWATFINNILFFLADVKIISSPRQQMLVLLFQRRVWPDPKKGPFSVLFSLSLSLCNVNLYFSSHRKASPGEQRGGFLGQLDVLEYNAISRWYSWKSSRYFPRLAQVQPAVKSLSFLYSLWIRMVRLWLHVHDTWTYRGVFNHWSNGDTLVIIFFFFFTAERPRLLRWTGRGGAESFLCSITLNYFCPLFSLRIVHWDR